MKAQLSQVVGDQAGAQLASVSGDTNPEHLGEDYVATTPFGRRVVYSIKTTNLRL